jgi:hypothetical protein
MPARAGAAVLQEPLAHQFSYLTALHQAQQKGMSQHRHREQLEPVRPGPDTHTLKAAFTFVQPPHLLNLPALQIRQGDLPGVFFPADGFRGEQIPGLGVSAHHHQSQRVVEVTGMPHLGPADPQPHEPVTACMPEQPLFLPLSFANHGFPGWPTAALLIYEMHLARPTDDGPHAGRYDTDADP